MPPAPYVGSTLLAKVVVALSAAVPFDDLALFGAGALAAVLLTVGVGLLFLRSSTAIEELRTG